MTDKQERSQEDLKIDIYKTIKSLSKREKSKGDIGEIKKYETQKLERWFNIGKILTAFLIKRSAMGGTELERIYNVPRQTFYNWRNELLQDGLIKEIKSPGHHKRSKYQITTEGVKHYLEVYGEKLFSISKWINYETIRLKRMMAHLPVLLDKEKEQRRKQKRTALEEKIMKGDEWLIDVIPMIEWKDHLRTDLYEIGISMSDILAPTHTNSDLAGLYFKIKREIGDKQDGLLQRLVQIIGDYLCKKILEKTEGNLSFSDFRDIFNLKFTYFFTWDGSEFFDHFKNEYEKRGLEFQTKNK
ncbi:MAG: hypothetical protein ACTSQI_14270 [Candidatus Helarchaeota archaeon]